MVSGEAETARTNDQNKERRDTVSEIPIKTRASFRLNSVELEMAKHIAGLLQMPLSEYINDAIREANRDNERRLKMQSEIFKPSKGGKS